MLCYIEASQIVKYLSLGQKSSVPLHVAILLFFLCKDNFIMLLADTEMHVDWAVKQSLHCGSMFLEV